MKDRISSLLQRAAQFQRSKLFFWTLIVLGPAAFFGHFFSETSSAQHLTKLVHLPLNPFLHQLSRGEKLGTPSDNHATEGLIQARGATRHRTRTGRIAGIFPIFEATARILQPVSDDVGVASGKRSNKTGKGVADERIRPYEYQKELAKFWNLTSNPKAWKQCPDQVAKEIPTSPGDAGFLKVICNGGLNQKRAAIADAVAVAWLLNRTLVVPVLETDRYWGDESGFSSIFNETHFINRLKGIVRVVREADLPPNLTNGTRVAQARGHVAFYQWLAQRYKRTELLILERFSHKLSYVDEHVSREVQRIRCFANLEALRFTSQIEAVGTRVVQRLRATGNGYVALHLRFEQDMLAHAKCDFEGSPEEWRELHEMRETFWPYRNWRDNDTIAGNRKAGRCPLKPEEVGRLLHFLGFPPTTTVYIASGPVYKADKSMPGLANLFPNLVRLTNSPIPGAVPLNITGLLNEEERKLYEAHADQLAALDYFACAHADVFIPSFTGNMDFLLEGERRYAGFRTTIVPNRPRLGSILSEDGLRFKEGQRRVYEVHPPVQRFGMEPSLGKLGTVLRHRHSVFSHPLPECMCYNGRMLSEEAYRTALTIDD